MACDLRCPNCGDNLGKDKENDALAYCGNCGESDIYNEYGYADDMSDDDIDKFKAMKRKRNRNTFHSRRY